MGTSISHHSPPTNNWRAVASTYLSRSIGNDRVVEEVWRAARNQPVGNISIDLAQPIILKCLQIALNANSPQEAYKETTKTIALSSQSTLATDIARRAVVNSFSREEERKIGFVKEIFSEAIDYLVSRDLPSYIGKGDRLKNVTDSISFKRDLKKRTENVINGFPVTNEIMREPDRWRDYVNNVAAALAKDK